VKGTGDIKVLEINARFGGSLMLRKNTADLQIILRSLLTIFKGV